MSNFNLNDYETVKERKKRFYENNPDGSIVVEIQNIDTVNDYALFKAVIFKNREDQKENIIWSTGYAHEIRDKELSIARNGKEYASVNYSAWVENCEESAIGRALDNAGYAGNNKCSREEIKKVERKNKSPEKQKGILEIGKKIVSECKSIEAVKLATIELYKFVWNDADIETLKDLISEKTKSINDIKNQESA